MNTGVRETPNLIELAAIMLFILFITITAYHIGIFITKKKLQWEENKERKRKWEPLPRVKELRAYHPTRDKEKILLGDEEDQFG